MRRFLILLSLLVPLSLRAQSLPQLQVEDGIVIGKLPCGASYYLIRNETRKGYAEFALIQKDYCNPAYARQLLEKSDNFKDVSQADFFASKGVAPGKDGLVSFKNGSTVFRFRNVPVYDEAARDSTIIAIFDLMRTCPFRQAVAVSGDIDTKNLADRFHILSMTVGRQEDAESEPYDWRLQEGLNFSVSSNRSSDVAEIKIVFESNRTAPELMNTAAPLVSKMFAKELGIVLRERISRAFYSSGLPLAAVSFRYVDSGRSAFNESGTLSVVTSASCLKPAVETVARILGGLDAHGISVAEYTEAREEFLYSLGRWKPREDNSAYVDRFICNFLYGASLASDRIRYNFFMDRRLPAADETGLFNSYVSALLNPEYAVSLNLSVPKGKPSCDSLSSVFSEVWKKAGADTASAFCSNKADTLRLRATKAKIRVKEALVEPVSGGTLWKMSNGLKVVYKKDTKSKYIHVGLLLRGGFSRIPDLKSGECGFVKDMIPLYDVAGMDGYDFSSMLRSNGISLSASASLSDLKISGTAPKEKLPLLLRSVLSFCRDRSLNPESFDYYRKCEALRLEARSHSLASISDVSLDSYLPAYRFSPVKNISSLGNNLPQRTEKYISGLLSKAQDGVIVIVGNMDEIALQKLLCRHLGDFRSSGSVFVRPKVSAESCSGWRTSTCASGLEEGAVSVTYSLNLPFCLESSVVFESACLALERKLSEELASTGHWFRISSFPELYPIGRYVLNVSCFRINSKGLPAGVRVQSSHSVLQAVRRAMFRAASEPLPESDLNAWKKDLQSRHKLSSDQPENIMNAVMARISYGKNFMSWTSETMNDVSVNAVQRVLESLRDNPKNEIIFK